MSLHRHVSAFGAVAEAYERGRPTFPVEAMDHLADRLGLRAGQRVCDVAAGTGKLTRQLVPYGCEVVAVEPVEGMRTVCARLLPSVRVLGATAEALPLAGDSVDAVTVAQAFHWFDAPRAFAEMHRVLRPGGRVALLWNIRDEEDPLERDASAVLHHHRGGTPGRGQLDLDAVIAASPFEVAAVFELPWSHRVERHAFLDRLLSVSFVAALEPADQAAVASELGEVFDRHEDRGLVTHAYLFQSHVLVPRG